MIAFLAVALAGSVFAMIWMYNATVNMTHNIADVKAELDAIGAQTIDMNNKIVEELSGDALQKVAAADGLVTEMKPQYFPLTKTPITQNDLSLRTAH